MCGLETLHLLSNYMCMYVEERERERERERVYSV